ncbi:MAG: ATP-binding cassette domain-containing protein [Oscillospiraceae bacterium]|jgi:ABC-type nitrate/sulfonate/bicarbonate transport system ATPase subunit
MIKIENIEFSYGDKLIFDRFSAEIGSGITLISGPSGSGKTTLMRLICGLIKPQTGQITGIEFGQAAIVFQEDRLLPWFTVRRNVLAVMDRGTPDSEADRFLELAMLPGEGDSMPDALSGGMRRRVALARAFAYGGELLALDEPFKGLDAALHTALLERIREISADKPVLLISHDPEDKNFADYSIEL